MKKILFILHYPPPMHGAAMVGRYIRQSDRINSQFDCRYINLGTSMRVDESGKGGLMKWFRYFKILGLTLYRSIVFKPDLTYITLTASGIGFYKDALVALLAKIGGKKNVYHFHNKGIRKRQDYYIDNLLYRWVFHDAEVILLSELLYPDIQKYVPRDRVHFCNNGIPNILEKITKARDKHTRRNIEILCLSNLIRSKGIFDLLKACKILQEKGLPFHCTFIGGEGDISPEDFNATIQDYELEDNVYYAGRKYGADKVAAYTHADIFVLYTYHDCFPLVVLEAMQFFLPVISTEEGGIPNIVEDGETGFIIRKNDPEMLADKLQTLINDPDLLSEMGRNGRARYEQDFTLEVFEKRFTNIIKEIA